MARPKSKPDIPVKETDDETVPVEMAKEIKKPSKDPANTPYDTLQIKLEVANGKYSGATILKVVSTCKIHPSSADRLNIHLFNSLLMYAEQGEYKVGDVVGSSVLKQICPGYNWA